MFENLPCLGFPKLDNENSSKLISSGVPTFGSVSVVYSPTSTDIIQRICYWGYKFVSSLQVMILQLSRMAQFAKQIL